MQTGIILLYRKKMKGILILFIVAIVCLILVKSNPETIDKILSQFENGPKKELFKVYHFLFNKKYDLNSEEGLRRYKIFKENLSYIKQINSEKHPYTLGLTQFADMTNQEYIEATTSGYEEDKARFLREVNFDVEADMDTINLSPPTATLEIDWRSVLGDARDQRSGCGSCWAFTTAAILEGGYTIKTGQKCEYLSPQQLLDCANLGGCHGSNAGRALMYTRINGLCKESEYPYHAKEETCKNLSCEIKNKSMQLCSNCSREEWTALLAKGPVAVEVDSSSRKIQLYKGGVLESLTDCVKITHAVVAVGITSDGVITIRNSWGVNWGERGHFRIKYQPENKDTCFITNVAMLPVF